MKSKASRKEIIKVKIKINKIEKQYRKINKIKSFFLKEGRRWGEKKKTKTMASLVYFTKSNGTQILSEN